MKKIITSLFLLMLLLGAFSVHTMAATLNLKLYLQGYYVGGGKMRPVLKCAYPGNTTLVDTILVLLKNTTNPYGTVDSVKVVLMIDGTVSCTFSNSYIGNAYYIAVRHSNTIQTWSKSPVTISAITSYDFSSAITQAYGNNMVQVDTSPNLWAFYSGDFNQDGNIDLIDFPALDNAINIGFFGCSPMDLNGDGNVDLLDFPALDANINAGIFARYP